MRDLVVEMVDLDRLSQHPDNANLGDLDAIEDSILVNDFYSPIVVQRSTGYILAGNHRYQVAYKLNWPQIPTIYIDVDDEKAKRIMLADNRTTRLGHDDDGLLVELLSSMQGTEDGLFGTGYTDGQLKAMADELSKPLDLGPEAPDPGANDAHPRPGMFLTVLPVPDNGHCYSFDVMRPDMASLTPKDLNDVRKALGLRPLDANELKAFDIEEWK